MENSIHTKAMLVSLNISQWEARKLDKKVTAYANNRYEASHKAGRFNKSLLPGMEEHEKVIKIGRDTRILFYDQTLPSLDEGWRILPTKNYWNFTRMINRRQSMWRDALQEFLTEYPNLVQQAKLSLGQMWNADDYPKVSRVERKFDLSVSFRPIPVEGDFRIALDDTELKRIEEETQNRIVGSVNTAMADAWDRLYRQVSRISERLSNPDNIFRNSLIENVREICEVLKRLNLTDDPNLEAMRKKVEDELSVYDPETLRLHKPTRAEVADKAADILKAMSAYTGGNQ